VIYTNRDQRPKSTYHLECADIVDITCAALSSGRIRQLSRGHGNSGAPIGWMQFKAKVPIDGKLQFPFPQDHKYSQADVKTVVEFIAKAHKNDGRYTVKLDRWYSNADVQRLVSRSKKLIKRQKEGEIVLPQTKPIAVAKRKRSVA